MYDSRFVNAKNTNGKLYRNKKTGDLQEYCMHSWLIYPVFEENTEYCANFIPEQCNRFKHFTGVCQFCGEVIYIHAEDVLANEEEYHKKVSEILKENE